MFLRKNWVQNKIALRKEPNYSCNHVNSNNDQLAKLNTKRLDRFKSQIRKCQIANYCLNSCGFVWSELAKSEAETKDCDIPLSHSSNKSSLRSKSCQEKT